MRTLLIMTALLGLGMAAPSSKPLLRRLIDLLSREYNGNCVETSFFTGLPLDQIPQDKKSAVEDLLCVTYSPADNIDDLKVHDFVKTKLKGLLVNGTVGLTDEDMGRFPPDHKQTIQYISNLFYKLMQMIEAADKPGATSKDAGDFMEKFYKETLGKQYYDKDYWRLIRNGFTALNRAGFGGYKDIETGCFDQGYDMEITESCIVRKFKTINLAIDSWATLFPKLTCHLDAGIRNLTENDSFETIAGALKQYMTCGIEFIQQVGYHTAEYSSKSAPLRSMIVKVVTEQKLTSLTLTLASEFGFFMHNTGRNPWAQRSLEVTMHGDMAMSMHGDLY